MNRPWMGINFFFSALRVWSCNFYPFPLSPLPPWGFFLNFVSDIQMTISIVLSYTSLFHQSFFCLFYSTDPILWISYINYCYILVLKFPFGHLYTFYFVDVFYFLLRLYFCVCFKCVCNCSLRHFYDSCLKKGQVFLLCLSSSFGIYWLRFFIWF